MPFLEIEKTSLNCTAVTKMSDQNLMRVSSRDHFCFLTQEIADCLETSLYTDLLIRCKNGFTIHAHKLVLAAASPFLKSLLDNDDQDEYQTLELPDTLQEDVTLLLEVIYKGLVEASIDELRRLVLLSHELFVSIPVSEELLAALDLTLPPRKQFLEASKSLPKLTLRPNGVAVKGNDNLSVPTSLPMMPLQLPMTLKTQMPCAVPLPTVPLPLPMAMPLQMQMPSIPMPLQIPSVQNIVVPDYSQQMGDVDSKIANENQSFSMSDSQTMSNSAQQNVCPICNASFLHLSNFRQHLRTHDSEELREQRNSILAELVSSGYDPIRSYYLCNICNCTYNHSGNFKQHLLKHERDSGSISALLVAQSKDGSNSFLATVLQSAMTDRVNNGDGDLEKAPYVCEYCMRGFKHPGNFKQHMATHLRSGKLPPLGEKRPADENNKKPLGTTSKMLKVDSIIICALCNQEFPNEDSLQDHISEHHVKIDPEQSSSPITVDLDISYSVCENCNESFETIDDLNQHKLECQPRNIEDNGYIDWTTAFKNKPGQPPIPTIEPPKRSASFGNASLKYCKICGRGFQKTCKLTAHLRIHSAPEDHYRYPCDICGKKFTRPQHVTRHKLLHTGEKPFSCQSCGKTFAREDKCKYHMRNECEKHRLLTLTQLHE